MSITSKILLSALLVGTALPAFAQGSVTAQPAASASGTSTTDHMTAKPVTTKPDAAKTATKANVAKPVATGTSAATVKPAAATVKPAAATSAVTPAKPATATN